MKLIEQVIRVGQLHHFSPRTIECYVAWIQKFLRYHRDGDHWRHPRELRGTHVSDFLTHLAADRKLSASSQNQAMAAIIFLYNQVLVEELGKEHLGLISAVRARRPKKVPTVLSTTEAARLLQALRGQSMARLMAGVLYGAGLRLLECCTLRIRDLDFDRAQIIVRAGKGAKDRAVMLPESLREPLLAQVEWVRAKFTADLQKNGGYSPLSDAEWHKMPYARRDFRWQFVFPSVALRRDDEGRGFRWYANPAALDRAIKLATAKAGLCKRVSAHTLRHSFATHVLERGYYIRQVQTLLGHESLKTTMIYTHVMNKPAIAVQSPLDRVTAGTSSLMIA